ncbi:hypothetical protein MPER_11438 [Moniliophthora perniciosa FA553]|nr:hypothetical protein MPER_11438 [Moniliophthora perniciosa FA553]
MRCTSLLTALALVSAASAASRYDKRKNVDRPNPSNLDHCPGHSINDADACTFESQSQGEDVRLDHIVGSPVDNCKGGTTDLKTTIGGDTSVAQTWKYGVSVGFSADSEAEKAKTFRQNIDITIQPGKKAALVAKVLHHTSLGRIRVNYGDPTGEAGKNDYHYIWYNNGVGSIQPTDDVVYDQRIVKCDEDI